MDDIFRNNGSVLDLLTSPYTFVNERLALHYDINNVRGDQFRKIKLADSNRFGLLGKGGVLMASSYPNRTSPVLRGAYVLERIMGTPPPIPPPAVPALAENQAGKKATTVRERLEEHRKKPQCFSCHAAIDPDRLHAGGLRCHRQGAPHRPLRAHRDRQPGRAARRHHRAQSGRAARGAARRPGALRAERDRAADHLLAGPRDRSRTTCRSCAPSCASRRPTTTDSPRSSPTSC